MITAREFGCTTAEGKFFNCLVFIYRPYIVPPPYILLLSVSVFYGRHFNGKKFLLSYRGRFNTDSSDSRDHVMKKKFNFVKMLQYNSYLSNINSIEGIRLAAENVRGNRAPSHKVIKNY